MAPKSEPRMTFPKSGVELNWKFRTFPTEGLKKVNSDVTLTKPHTSRKHEIPRVEHIPGI